MVNSIFLAFVALIEHKGRAAFLLLTFVTHHDVYVLRFADLHMNVYKYVCWYMCMHNYGMCAKS